LQPERDKPTSPKNLKFFQRPMFIEQDYGIL
jgi:hypothetical protein